MRTLSVALAIVALTGLALSSQETQKQEAGAPAAEVEIIRQQLPSYPLTTCPISHESLDANGKPKDIVHEGRLVRLCCGSCVKGFQKDPATVLKAIDAAVIEAQKASYPLKTCPISGEALGGEMGDPIDVVHGTRLVRLCCKACVKGFQKDPAKTMAKIDAALIADQKKTYPLTTCLVSGETIEGEGFDHLYGTRLTRFCCEKCAASFDKEPAKYLAKLDAAATTGSKAPAKN